jgi:hypothetical protein
LKIAWICKTLKENHLIAIKMKCLNVLESIKLSWGISCSCYGNGNG